MNKNITEHVFNDPITLTNIKFNFKLAYTGTKLNKMAHGQGLIHKRNNVNYKIYEGEFDLGQIKGYGKRYVNNIILTDGYHNGMVLDGYGKSYEEGEIKSIGYYQNGHLDGYGIKFYSNNNSDEGIFNHDSLVTGTWTTTVFTFTGEYTLNKPNGYGVLEFHKSSRFKKIWGLFNMGQLYKINEMIVYMKGKEVEVKLINNNSSYYSMCMEKYPDLIDNLYIYNRTDNIYISTIKVADKGPGSLIDITLIDNIVEIIPYD